MPHIIVEHSVRLLDEVTHEALLQALHGRLAAEPSVDIQRIKTRSVSLEDVIVGDDSQDDLMMHIVVKLMSGRSVEIRKEIAQDFKRIASEFLGRCGKNTCAVTVEIAELDPETYQA